MITECVNMLFVSAWRELIDGRMIVALGAVHNATSISGTAARTAAPTPGLLWQVQRHRMLCPDVMET